jgi:hypothetical protein
MASVLLAFTREGLASGVLILPDPSTVVAPDRDVRSWRRWGHDRIGMNRRRRVGSPVAIPTTNPKVARTGGRECDMRRVCLVSLVGVVVAAGIRESTGSAGGAVGPARAAVSHRLPTMSAGTPAATVMDALLVAVWTGARRVVV